jgi:hypothetical protein
MFKKIALLLAALAVSAPAFADRGHHRNHYYVKHRPVVHHYHHYRPAPRPVVHHYYHRPAPRPVYVVERHHHVNPVAVLAGAVIGAAIVHHVVTGY